MDRRRTGAAEMFTDSRRDIHQGDDVLVIDARGALRGTSDRDVAARARPNNAEGRPPGALPRLYRPRASPAMGVPNAPFPNCNSPAGPTPRTLVPPGTHRPIQTARRRATVRSAGGVPARSGGPVSGTPVGGSEALGAAPASSPPSGRPGRLRATRIGAVALRMDRTYVRSAPPESALLSRRPEGEIEVTARWPLPSANPGTPHARKSVHNLRSRTATTTTTTLPHRGRPDSPLSTPRATAPRIATVRSGGRSSIRVKVKGPGRAVAISRDGTRRREPGRESAPRRLAARLSRADARHCGAATGPRSRPRGAGRSLRRTAVHPRTSAIGRSAGDRPTPVHRAAPRLRPASGRCVGPASNRRAHPGTHSQSTSRPRGSRSSGWRSNTRRHRRPAPAGRRTDARP